MMNTMDVTTPETLSDLLADERAAVEALVGLVAMATDGLERQAMVVFGGQTAQACHELRALLERHGVTVSMRVGAPRHIILGQERYDDRLRAYSQLQQSLADRIEALMNGELDADAQAVLAPLRALHLAHYAWALARADDFTASREAANEQARQANPQGAAPVSRPEFSTPRAERPPAADPPAPDPAPSHSEPEAAPEAATPSPAPEASAPVPPPLRLPVSKTALTGPPAPKLIEPPQSSDAAPAETAEAAPRPATRVRRTRPRAAEGAASPTDAGLP
jgi:hypothetical protein